MAFTAEEVDYLDTKAEGEALRAKQALSDGARNGAGSSAGNGAKAGKQAARKAAAKAPAAEEFDDIPF
jgi:hypothetical protein